MSDLLQTGLHPDADVLSAFAENALPPHERTATLAHLAACARCREIVFLAQQAAPLAEPAPAPAWQRWFNTLPLFGIGIGAAALAGAALLFITLRPHPGTAPSVATREPLTVQPPLPVPAALPAIKPPRPPSPPRALPKPALPQIEPPLLRAGPPRPMRPAPPMAAGNNFMARSTGSGMVAGIGRAPGVAMAAPVRPLSMHSVQGDALPQSGFGGSGQGLAVAPRASAVTLGSGQPAQTAAAAAPTAAPPTAADALAAPGSMSETVTVQSANQQLTMDASAANGTLQSEAPKAVMAKKRNLQTSPGELPSKLRSTWLVSAGPRTLAADTAGALFLSLDAGRHWQPVAAAWPGRVAQLKLAAAPAIFQLLTTTGATWLSPDGLHWQPQ